METNIEINKPSPKFQDVSIAPMQIPTCSDMKKTIPSKAASAISTKVSAVRMFTLPLKKKREHQMNCVMVSSAS